MTAARSAGGPQTCGPRAFALLRFCPRVSVTVSLTVVRNEQFFTPGGPSASVLLEAAWLVHALQHFRASVRNGVPISSGRVSWALTGTVWGPAPCPSVRTELVLPPPESPGSQTHQVSPLIWVSFNFAQQYFVVLNVKVLQIFVEFIPRYCKYFFLISISK